MDYDTKDPETGIAILFRKCNMGDLLLMEHACSELTPLEYYHFLLCKEIYPDIRATLN